MTPEIIYRPDDNAAYLRLSSGKVLESAEVSRDVVRLRRGRSHRRHRTAGRARATAGRRAGRSGIATPSRRHGSGSPASVAEDQHVAGGEAHLAGLAHGRRRGGRRVEAAWNTRPMLGRWR